MMRFVGSCPECGVPWPASVPAGEIRRLLAGDCPRCQKHWRVEWVAERGAAQREARMAAAMAEWEALSPEEREERFKRSMDEVWGPER